MKSVWAVVAVVAAAAIWAANSAGDFADADGFSGKNGVDCTSCHAVPPQIFPAVEPFLSGLPDAWQHDQLYNLTITMSGGPPAAPDPQPQGGFELESSGGTMLEPPGFGHLLRVPKSTEISYEPAGTLMRSWNVSWQAPSLDAVPQPVGFWLAVLAANGNHVIATNVSDGGEHGDMMGKMHIEIPPSQETIEAWRALPLALPTITSIEQDANEWVIQGSHGDLNATKLEWSLDAGPWLSRPTANSWRLTFADLHPGTHELAIKSVGLGRESGPATVSFGEGRDMWWDSHPEEEATPALPLAVVCLIMAALVGRRRCNEL